MDKVVPLIGKNIAFRVVFSLNHFFQHQSHRHSYSNSSRQDQRPGGREGVLENVLFTIFKYLKILSKVNL